MPTYDYECRGCEHRFEAFQSIKDGALRKCPECKKLRLRRLIGTGGGFLFKGSGFYETDYRSSSYKDAAKKDTESSSSGDSDSKKSDSSKSTDSSSTDSSSPKKSPDAPKTEK